MLLNVFVFERLYKLSLKGVQPNYTRILALRKVSIFSIKPPLPPPPSPTPLLVFDRLFVWKPWELIYPQDFFRGSIKINIVLIVSFTVLLLLHFDNDITT